MQSTETTVDLQWFCSTDPFRPYLHKPWSFGDYTYATNGHICGRVQRITEIPECGHAPGCQAAKIFDDSPVPKFRAMRLASLPDPEMAECDMCSGRGRAHDCPGCDCVCEECAGTGEVETVATVTINGAPFNVKYIRLLLKIGATIADIELTPGIPMRFQFLGGEGVLMGTNRRRGNHLDIDI